MRASTARIEINNGWGEVVKYKNSPSVEQKTVYYFCRPPLHRGGPTPLGVATLPKQVKSTGSAPSGGRVLRLRRCSNKLLYRSLSLAISYGLIPILLRLDPATALCNPYRVRMGRSARDPNRMEGRFATIMPTATLCKEWPRFQRQTRTTRYT